jgi:integrase
MQKKDIYNHIKIYEKWEEQLSENYLEDGLNELNTKLFIDYFKDLAKRQSIGYVNRNRSKLKSIFVGLQNNGIKDISKSSIKEVEDYFFNWCKNHSIDYALRWNAFWNWWKTKNRKEGKVVLDLNLTLNDFKKKGENVKESTFVWITKEEFDKFRSYFDEEKQLILLFAFDTLIRFPTEISSLKVENIFEKNNEVWVNIPKEISKTIGRKFNLVYSGEALLNYIKKNDKKPDDYLFNFSAPMLNQEMQKIAKQLFGERKSEGGEFFKNITGYDLRHSGAIHFRQLFQQTGQSLDLLRERGGWSDFTMINFYTKRLGLDGHIQKEKLLLEEDKTQMEKELLFLKGGFEEQSKAINILLEANNERQLSSLPPKERKRITARLEEVRKMMKESLKK